MGKHKELAFEQLFSFFKKYQYDIKNKKILDVGCGTGGFLDYAKDFSTNLYGFDASEAQIKYANQYYPNLKVAWTIEEYLQQLPNKNIIFDLITMWDVLEHIRNPQEFLKPIISKLSSGGLFYAAIPGAWTMVQKDRLTKIVGKTFDYSPHEHVVYHTPQSLQYLCDALELENLSIGSVSVYVRPQSIFESIRRGYFQVTSDMPSIAPQLYLLGRKK
jgi:2-polyprenyl-3-methyl-5-hydroxy-6-metoxy-1,4-benzoquinol methylase